jgi:hypothetical protein
MNRRITRFLSLALAAGSLAVCASAQAQQGFGRFGGGPLRVLELTPALETRVKLTEDQKGKMNAMREALQKEGAAAAAAVQAGGEPREAFQKIRQLAEKSEGEALALLTPDQKKEFDALKVEAEGYQGLGRSRVVILSITGLTDPQKGQLKTLATETQGKRREIIQGAGDDRQAAFQKMRALEQESAASIKKVLTADQQKQFDDVLKTLPAGPGGLRRNQ